MQRPEPFKEELWDALSRLYNTLWILHPSQRHPFITLIMGELGDFNVRKLEDNFPSFPWYTLKDLGFRESRQTYCASNPAIPRAILRPQNAEDVSAIVSFARQLNIPFSVRTGGHDLYGRSIVHDALCIDMRDIEFVEIASDRKTAVVGGGVRFGKLLTELHRFGLTTPHGSVPAIGYVGWASLGGYGCSSTNFGLGVDQIVDAEVVNDQGEIVRADEQMLKGIRGAGGNFGIVTSLRIKVYEVNTVSDPSSFESCLLNDRSCLQGYLRWTSVKVLRRCSKM